VGLGNIEVDEERGDRLRSHAGTAIGMERKGPAHDSFVQFDDLLLAATEIQNLPSFSMTGATRRLAGARREAQDALARGGKRSASQRTSGLDAEHLGRSRSLACLRRVGHTIARLLGKCCMRR
jgi:hypothetical protein